ncbi:MAG: CBS domain-containing protein [Thermoplasmata archaeon]|nr:CBS domain-containing protein [Thermoplasmata archaeon]MBR4686110.1 CBS domain-containing protein [Candidatus Methanomethylophilaceae archaeon]WII08246.1 CBS domain-containing protein [Methanomassiliicoccales archaeon LGM-RCC1]
MTKLKVRDLMTTEVLTLHPEDTIKMAAKRLALDNVSGAPIVDNKNHLLGFVSENDILHVIMNYQTKLEKHNLSDRLLDYSMDSVLQPDDNLKQASEEISNIEMSQIMVRSVMTTSPDAAIIEVLSVMLKMGINRIPVVEKGILVGIISRGDIIFSLYKRKA